MFSEMTPRLASIRWWIIINKDQQYKVIDLTLAGVSLTLQKKDEFTSYLSNKSVSQLINNLSKKFDQIHFSSDII